MSDDSSRRFTDREVALVLRKATELDEERGVEAGAGLTRKDLEEIAREVGISPESLGEAVERLGRKSTTGEGLLRAPKTQSAVHSVQGELNEEALATLMRIVEEDADAAGTVSQALGSLRWTATDRLKSTQVTITPAAGETSIRVVERASARLGRMLVMIPAAWGVMLGGALVASPGTGTGAGITALVGGALAGAAAGRAAWTWLSRSSAARVERLAGELAREAREAAKAGLLEP